MDVVVQVEKFDRVLTDRSAGQSESGWWVAAENYDIDQDDSGLFFLSEDGTLYGKDGDRSWGKAIGYQPGLREAAAKLDMETLEPIPGRPGWAVDGTGTEWYSDAWLDGHPTWDTDRIITAMEAS